MKKYGILTFNQFHKRVGTGGSRIRGEWLVDHWPEAELFVQGQSYKGVIYQKAYFIDHARALKTYVDENGQTKNVVKILDICDPDFLWWQGRVIEMAKECDAITASTQKLADDLQKFVPGKRVLCIKDRMDLSYHSEKKVHEGDAKKVVWFGYSSNFEMLLPVLTFLEKLNLGLIVISDKVFSLPARFIGKVEVENYNWRVDTVNSNIIKGDIVINPQSSAGRWKYKSENKTITAYLLGMPVAKDATDLERLIKCEERQKDALINLEFARQNYDVNQSVAEYQKLIDEIHFEKNK
jgi:hypothetical protein